MKEIRRFLSTLLFEALFVLGLLCCSSAQAIEGVEEGKIEPIVRALGVEPKGPVLDFNGDALLFVAFGAGALAGGVAGYCLRALIQKDQPR
jgi:hypothetical protein